MRRTLTAIAGTLVVAACLFNAVQDGKAGRRAAGRLVDEPLDAVQASLPRALFVENRGQWGTEPGYSLYGTSMRVRLESGRIGVRAGSGPEDPGFAMRFGGADPVGEEQETRVNWMVGKDRERWRVGLPAYRSMRYEQIAEGVDLVVRASDAGLRYDLELAPGSDASSVSIEIEGAEELLLAETGELIVRTKAGDVRQSPPLAWQDTDQGAREIGCAFRLLGGSRYGFETRGRDPGLPAVIDPTLQIDYESYFIGDVHAIVTDPASGDFFVGGIARDAFPLPAAVPAVNAIGDPTVALGNQVSYIARLSSTGTPSIKYLTLVGGTADDYLWDLALDSATGRLYAFGGTSSDDFPVTGGPPFGATRFDGFFFGLDAALGDAMLVSTYLDIEVVDLGNMVLDGGRALASGTLTDPQPGAFPSIGVLGDDSAFVIAIDLLTGARNGGFLVGDANGQAVGVDPGVAIYLAGGTGDPNAFPETSGAFDVPIPPAQKKKGQTTPPPGDVFLVRLDTALTQAAFSTRIGGEGLDFCFDLVVDGNRVAMIGDTTSSSMTPDPVGGDSTFGGDRDAFVTVLDFAGFVPGSTPSVPLMAYHGSSGLDFGRAVEIDAIGRIHVAGWTSPSSGGGGRGNKRGGGGPDPFPEVDNGTGLFKQGLDGRDGFYSVFDLSVSGNALVYSTLIGGAGQNEGVEYLALSPDGKAHVVLQLNSTGDMPTSPTAAYPVRLPGLNGWIVVLGPVL